MTAARALNNESGLDFVDISMEEWRRYEFSDGPVVIQYPQWLAVTDNGHRVLDLDGLCHYIPKTWKQLVWKPFADGPDFVC